MKSDALPIVRRTILRIAIALFFVALAGATYQGVATAIERHRYPRPGGMVDAGGHQLHIYCTGSGSPVVVLEAPAAGGAAAWGWVQPPVARATRTCSYDRAGLGWSERGDGQYHPEATTEELHLMLDRAHEKPPFVVVGDGFGASLATLFAARFGSETAALVLVNPPSRGNVPQAPGPLAGIDELTPWLARVGVLRTLGRLPDRAIGLPPASEGPLRAFLNRPDHLTRAADELSRWDEVVELANAAPIAAVPVTRVAGAPAGRAAFLTTEPAARPVVAAILDAVARVRARKAR